MNIQFPRSKPVRFVGRLLGTAAMAFAAGALNMPAVQAAGDGDMVAIATSAIAAAPAAAAPITPVPVDQEPLTLRPVIPPDITLMFDDSGSMSWNFMPDWDSLDNNGNNDAVIDAANNGVYYDPTVTYSPPPKVDGTSYPSQTDMTNAPEDGFGVRTTNTFNLYTYDGSYDYYECGGGVCGGSAIDYNTSNQQSVPVTRTYDDYASSDTSCKTTYNSNSGFGGYTYTAHSGTWYLNGVKEKNGGECTFRYNGTTTQTFNYFQYSTGAAGGPYTVHYIASASQGCGTQTNCLLDTDTSGTSAPSGVSVGQNVANWFAYYHTRILMAKSGLMTAFSGLDPDFRVGFGSINGNNDSNLPSDNISKNSTKIAEDQVFGDGSSGTQKANLWSWVSGLKANNSTPLRTALDAVGQYYQTSQPWTTMSSDPGYGTDNQPSNIACRQAYTILTTDGFWNDFFNSVGDVDGTAGPSITGPNSQSYAYSPALPYEDGSLSTTTTTYDADCSTWSGTLNTGNGYCSWTQYKYTTSKHGSTRYQYGSCPASYYSCSVNKTGTSFGCSSGDTWDATSMKCVHTETTGSTYSNTLADVAMKYWETDLQSGILNEVPPSNEDPAFWQHMTTFTLGLGFAPTGISPSGTTIAQIFNWADGGSAISGFSWPKPAADSINNIADLAHAAVNGHGGFYSATSPQSFSSGIQNALTRATERVGTGASLAANSTQLTTGTVVYQANYYTASWKGDLKAMSVDPDTGAISSTATWSAASVLQNSATTTSGTDAVTFPDRNVWTWSYKTGGTGAVAFKDNSDGTPPSGLSPTQLTNLGADATSQANLVNYLRGDSTLEQANGGSYRSRNWALGDVVDSQPVYSGPPNTDEFVNQTFAGYSYDPSDSTSTTSPFTAWASGTTDSSGKFTASAASTRTPLVFVSSNDGMLHAFNASSGAEVFAYLPGALLNVTQTDPVTGLQEPLSNLANPNYGDDSTPHQFYNDGELTIADAYVKLSGETAPGWHTILVGTTGRGPARTVYALDVTNPSSIKPIWERYAGDSSALDSNSGYIGEMVGKPVIAQTGGYDSSGSPLNPTWSVLIGNGYNSPNGVAALLQFDLATGQLYVHKTDSQTSNGLAAPLAWMDDATSGISDMAYAGDLLGRVWSFPLDTVTTSNKGGTTTTTYTPDTTTAGTKLFTATDSSGTAQPITAGMLVGTNPEDNSVWAFFGTGKYLTQADITDNSVQTWYGIKVQTSPGGSQVTTANRSSLVNRSIIYEDPGNTSANPPILPTRAVTPTPTSDDMKNKNGWYMDLVSPYPNGSSNPTKQGERMVVPNQFQGSLLLGTTRIPEPGGSNTDPCNPAGGGWIMALDPFTGTNPDASFFDTNGDGVINGSDMVTVNGQQVPAAGVGFSSLPNAPIFTGGVMEVSFDNGTTSSLKTSGGGGETKRVSWRELIND